MQSLRTSLPLVDMNGQQLVVKSTHRNPDFLFGQDPTSDIFGPRHHRAKRKMFLLQVLHGIYTEKEKGKYICARNRTKERVARGLADCSNQSTAIHFQKASLHHTAHIPCPCVPPGARPYMPAAAPLLKSQRLCVIKERVAPDLLVHLQNQSNGICYSPQVIFPSQEG